MKLNLNRQQQTAVEEPGNVLVTACPGSGKTRVLIHRIIKELSELESKKHHILAVTFTNRAADEIKSRLDHPDILLDNLWAGTIHSFSLDWILRPYACYSNYLKKGFSVADEFYIRSLKNKLKKIEIELIDGINVIYIEVPYSNKMSKLGRINSFIKLR